MLHTIPDISHWRQTTASGNLTLDASHQVVLCNNTSDRTVSLPVAADLEHKTYAVKKIGANNAKVTLDPNGSEQIDGEATLDLFVENDALWIVSDGSEWRILADSRIRHTVRLTRDAAQSISSAAWNKIAFDNEDFDVGAIGDVTTNDRVDIRRTGKYLVTARYHSLYSGTGLTGCGVKKNGSFIALPFLYHSTQTTSFVSEVWAFSAGDYIELFAYQNSGASKNTDTTEWNKPSMTVSELRS